MTNAEIQKSIELNIFAANGFLTRRVKPRNYPEVNYCLAMGIAIGFNLYRLRDNLAVKDEQYTAITGFLDRMSIAIKELEDIYA